jgi:NitT/TauT family transport system substrate-binding protein
MPEKRIKPEKIKIGIVASIILAICAAGYLLFTGKLEQGPVGPLPKITIAHSTLPYAALAQIAQVRGIYRREGLDASPVLFDYGKPALEAVVSGRADFATVAETPVMLAIMNGAKILILATIDFSRKSHGIVMRRNGRIPSPDHLRGKRIGTTLGTSAEFYLDSFLAGRGISREDVEVVDLRPEDLGTAFMAGRVAAVSTFAPVIFRIEKEAGDRAVTFIDDAIYSLMFNVVATRQYVEKNPEIVRKMLRALLRAEEFARDDPSTAQRIVAGFNRMDLAMLKESWGASSFRVSLDQALVMALEDESRWAIRKQLTKMHAVPNYLDYIFLNGLRSLKPKAVGISR